MTKALENTTFVFRREGLTEDEVYALLTEDAAGVLFPEEDAELLQASVSANAGHTGAMIALVPSQDDLDRMVVEGGEAYEDLHLTLAFLGEAALIDDDMRGKIVRAASSYFGGPLTAEASGIYVLNPHTDDRETAIVAGVRGENLVGPRENVMSALRGMYAMPDQFQPWLPHVTLEYSDDIGRAQGYVDRLGPVVFDTLRIAFGDEVTDIPLRAPGSDVGGGQALTAGAFKRWLEKDHPRDSDGKFGHDGGASFDVSSRESVESAAPISVKNLSRGDKIGNVTGGDVGDAVNALTSGTSRHINNELRRTKGKLKDIQDAPGTSSPTSVGSANIVRRDVSRLDEGMTHSKLTDDVVVMRAISDPARTFGNSWKSDGDNSGLTWSEPSFLSTTTDEKYLSDYVRGNAVKMRIRVPKGTGGIFLEKAGETGEDLPQLLLQRGLKLRVVNDGGSDGGTRTLDVEVIKA